MATTVKKTDETKTDETTPVKIPNTLTIYLKTRIPNYYSLKYKDRFWE